jgi:hypothetical protein
MAVELQPLVLESSLTMQKILEASNHEARCKLLNFFFNAERRRLTTKKSLQRLFSGESAASESAEIPPEETISDNDNVRRTKPESKSIFFDEPDAFQ